MIKKRTKYLMLLLLLALAYLGYHFPLTFDVTHHKNNSLSLSSQNVLSKLENTFYIELTTPDRDIANQITATVSLFQKESSKISLKVHLTSLSPQEKAAFHLKTNHTLSFRYGDQKKIVDLDPAHWSEHALANFMYQVLRNNEDWTVFLSGHGELELTNTDNRHLSQLTSGLKQKGLNFATLNLGETGSLPRNTKVLVIADNQKPLLPKEMDELLHYVQQGGNLLWLANPSTTHPLNKLAKVLGIRWLNGTLLDPKAHAMGTPHPAINLIMHYPKHPITQSLNMLSVFPWARPLDYTSALTLGWAPQPLLITESTTQLNGSTQKKGPFTIGVALQKGKQRIVVIGNSHFLSNSTIHNYGNADLAHNIFHWLNETDVLLNTQTTPAMDLNFADTPTLRRIRDYVFPYLLPLCYLFFGWRLKKSRYQQHRFL